jgi:pantoate kinase
MAATPESKVKLKIKAILKAHGVYFAMPIGSAFGNSGVPDFLCCVCGQFLAIEAKAGKGRTTALQDKHLADIEEAGGRTVVINEEALRLGVLEAILENME